MTPEHLSELRRLVDGIRTEHPGGGVDPATVLALLDCIEEQQQVVRSLREGRARLERRAMEAEATAERLREELDDVTAGWFDTVREVDFSEPVRRPLLRAIEGGAGS